MNVLHIDAVSFATNIGQAAAAQIAALLYAGAGDGPLDPIINWFSTGPGQSSQFLDAELLPIADDGVAAMLEGVIQDLGAYVCKHRFPEGERLFRYAASKNLVGGQWVHLTFEQQQAWQTFTGTTGRTYLELAVAQQAILDVQRVAGAPAPMRREDNALLHDDEVEPEGLQKEAIAAAGMMGTYRRGQEVEQQRLDDEAWSQMRLDAEADNAEFDRQASIKVAEAKKSAAALARRTKAAKPAPLSAGESPVRPPINRGGRGNKKTV